MIRRFSILFLLLLISCVPQPVNTPRPASTSLPSTASEAQQTLIEFFALLNAGKYAEADALYGGTYENIHDNNPYVDLADHAQLLENACEINGYSCLLVRSATFKELRGDTYVFQVEFSNPDGSLFVLGPCCGGNETDMPPISQFEYAVTRNAAGKFLVMKEPVAGP